VVALSSLIFFLKLSFAFVGFSATFSVISSVVVSNVSGVVLSSISLVNKSPS
jgi:hypothetical protein